MMPPSGLTQAGSYTSHLAAWIVLCLGAILLVDCGDQPSFPVVAVQTPPSPGDPQQHHHRLARSSSPYLLQHADNPVDWYEWGDEAFHAAKDQDRPIFLSVGYATCHWCHVMARECFSDPAIAAYMNEHFICIKVDREQRPDIDQVYMEFVQQTTGSGGWPMSVWLTPELKPLFGGTYFPPTDQGGRPGFLSILRRIDEVWHRQRADLEHQAAQGLAALQAQIAASAPGGAEPAGTTPAATLVDAFRADFDAVHGGFGDAPKFPRPAALAALLRAHRLQLPTTTGHPALDMVVTTLRSMDHGGIHDHIGGGFHRYCTDNAWSIPHFEKMLYDQGQLAALSAEVFRLTGDQEFAALARDLCSYVIRDLSEPSGAFVAGEDADSQLIAGSAEHDDGAFYLWDDAQIANALTTQEAAAFRRRFALVPCHALGAQMEQAHEGAILVIAEADADIAKDMGLETVQVDALVASSIAKLAATRRQRPRPQQDDTVITAWNGLMISGLARTAALLDEPRYAEAASAAALAIRNHLYDASSGTLYRSWRHGRRDPTPGCAADYAFLAQGLIDLSDATGDASWLAWACELLRRLDRDFADPQGGWYDTDGHDERILVRTRTSGDFAEPAPSSVALSAGVRVAELLQDRAYRERLATVSTALRRRALKDPLGMPLCLAATTLSEHPLTRVLISGAGHDADALVRITHHATPDLVGILLTDGARRLLAGNPALPALLTAATAPASAEVWSGSTCLLTTADPAALARKLVLQP